MAAGSWVAGHDVSGLDAERNECCYAAHILLFIIWDPSPWDNAAHPQGRSSLYLSGNNFTDISRGVFPRLFQNQSNRKMIDTLESHVPTKPFVSPSLVHHFGREFYCVPPFTDGETWQ